MVSHSSIISNPSNKPNIHFEGKSDLFHKMFFQVWIVAADDFILVDFFM